MSNRLSLREDVAEVLRPQHVPQRCGCQQPRGPAVVVHVRDSPCSVGDLVVHDGVDKDGDAVLGEDFLRGDLVGGRPHVDLLVDVDAGDDEEHTRTTGAP